VRSRWLFCGENLGDILIIVQKLNSVERKFAITCLSTVTASDQCIAFESSYHIEQGSLLCSTRIVLPRRAYSNVSLPLQMLPLLYLELLPRSSPSGEHSIVMSVSVCVDCKTVLFTICKNAGHQFNSHGANVTSRHQQLTLKSN